MKLHGPDVNRLEETRPAEVLNDRFVLKRTEKKVEVNWVCQGWRKLGCKNFRTPLGLSTL